MQETAGQAFPLAKRTAIGNRSSAKVKILVADDEQLIADTLAAILKGCGFEARAVYDGRAAVDAIAAFEADVLIGDVMMPGMTGIEAAIEILALRPSCKILLFSGQASTSDQLHSARALGYSFEILAKPVHPSDLLAKVRSFDLRPALQV